jgi:3-oxoadipate enol-lactonase
MGGTVGQIFAYTYPEYVNKLVLSDSFCELPNQTSKWVLSLTILLARLLPKSFINAATYSIHKGKEPDEVYTREVLKRSTTFTKKQFIEMKKSTFPINMRSNLRHITAPTLVVYGDKKQYGIDEEKAAVPIYQNIPKAILAGFKGAFDPVTIMRKDKFNEVAYHFLNDLQLPELEGVFYRYK